MKASHITRSGHGSVLLIRETGKPQPKTGKVFIQVQDTGIDETIFTIGQVAAGLPRPVKRQRSLNPLQNHDTIIRYV